MMVTRRLVSTLLAVFTTALGVFAAAQAVPQLRGYNRPLWVNYYIVTEQLSQRPWNDPYILGAGGVLLVLGLVLLTLAVRTGPRPLRLAPIGEQIRVVMPATHLRRVAEAAAYEIDDVTAAKVKARRRKVRVTATTHPQAEADLAARVRDQVTERLGALTPARRRPRVKVRIKRKGR